MEKVFKKEHLISVIIPIYNVEKYLKRCVDSVINQTYKNLEIILVDDGSNDNSGKICDEYALKDNRIKVIHKENNGVSSARNMGLEKSKGYWIAFVDADDWLDKDYCETLYNASLNYSCDIIASGYKRISNEFVEKINYEGNVEVISPSLFVAQMLNVQNGLGFVHTKLIKRKIINNVVFNTKLSLAEDALFNLEVCKNAKEILILKKALYNYRVNEDSAVRKFDANYSNKFYTSMELIKKYILKNFSENIDEYYNFAAYHVMIIAVNYCFNKLNKSKIKSMCAECKREIYKEAIKKSNYRNLSITRKITLFTIKYKLYILTYIICYIRQNQNGVR